MTQHKLVVRVLAYLSICCIVGVNVVFSFTSMQFADLVQKALYYPKGVGMNPMFVECKGITYETYGTVLYKSDTDCSYPIVADIVCDQVLGVSDPEYVPGDFVILAGGDDCLFTIQIPDPENPTPGNMVELVNSVEKELTQLVLRTFVAGTFSMVAMIAYFFMVFASIGGYIWYRKEADVDIDDESPLKETLLV